MDDGSIPLFEGPEPIDHWVYFAMDPNPQGRGDIHIGHAQHVKRRMNNKDLRDKVLFGQLPCQPPCPHWVTPDGKCHCALEERFHLAHDKARWPNGEWFCSGSLALRTAILWEFKHDPKVQYYLEMAAALYRRRTA